jgi:hypothetical protein
MPTYFVTLQRPEIVAATTEEATQLCMSEPLGPNDTFYVREVPEGGSTYYVAGGVATLGGGYMVPTAIIEGSTVKKE